MRWFVRGCVRRGGGRGGVGGGGGVDAEGVYGGGKSRRWNWALGCIGGGICGDGLGDWSGVDMMVVQKKNPTSERQYIESRDASDGSRKEVSRQP